MARYDDVSASAQDQIRQLRDEVDGLMRDRVSPMVQQAAGRAQDYARQAQDIAGEQLDAVSGRVRDMPITAILVSAALGYVIGRIAR